MLAKYQECKHEQEVKRAGVVLWSLKRLSNHSFYRRNKTLLFASESWFCFKDVNERRSNAHIYSRSWNAAARWYAKQKLSKQIESDTYRARMKCLLWEFTKWNSKLKNSASASFVIIWNKWTLLCSLEIYILLCSLDDQV